MTTKSPLKWAGGKYRLLHDIFEFFPREYKDENFVFESDIKSKPFYRFVEPFFGGGSVGLNTEGFSKKGIINDSNKELINFWKTVKEKPEELLDKCKLYFTPQNNTEDAFYKNRETFNTTSDILEKAALFLYLNKHCFNGLCRFNKSGKFNVPFGKYKSPVLPVKELNIASQTLKNFDILNLDFRDIMNMTGEGDAVYCDPPYLPLSITSNFSSYGVEEFTLEDQQVLADLALESSKRGATVVISNHYTEHALQIYKNASNIKQISVSRFISGKGESRGEVFELLAAFLPK